MSILIKGATLPDSCWDCEADFAYQIGCELWQDYEEFCERRHPNCPLIEIPTPHGRIIDEKELKDLYSQMPFNDNEIRFSKNDIYCNLWNIKTILEAEE